MKTQSLIPVERIQRAIHLLRGGKVMLDADLAALDPTTKMNPPPSLCFREFRITSPDVLATDFAP
jgi:hypothetical protein